MLAVSLSSQPPSSDLKIFWLACVYNVLQLYTSLINSATSCCATPKLWSHWRRRCRCTLFACVDPLWRSKASLHRGNTLAKCVTLTSAEWHHTHYPRCSAVFLYAGDSRSHARDARSHNCGLWPLPNMFSWPLLAEIMHSRVCAIISG